MWQPKRPRTTGAKARDRSRRLGEGLARQQKAVFSQDRAARGRVQKVRQLASAGCITAVSANHERLINGRVPSFVHRRPGTDLLSEGEGQADDGDISVAGLRELQRLLYVFAVNQAVGDLVPHSSSGQRVARG